MEDVGFLDERSSETFTLGGGFLAVGMFGNDLVGTPRDDFGCPVSLTLSWHLRA